MNENDTRSPGLRSLLDRLRSRDISPAEAVGETARKVEALPKELNPFMCVDFDLALDRARQMTTPTASELPLYGLPMSMKDLEPTADLPTTFGAAFVDSRAPRADGSLAARLRAAGCVIFGKTSTPAFGHKDVTDNLITGATRNPWNPALTSGGSSGGAAVLVATGVSPVAHGTDAAGSVRMPAALCGVAGFKPSYGRLPRLPASDLWAARGHHGFLARSIEDLRICMDAVAGGDPRDPLAPSDPVWDTAPPREPRGQIALVDSLFGQEVDRGVAALLRRVGDMLSDAGIVVKSPDIRWSDPVAWANVWHTAHEHHHFGETYRRNPELFSPSHAAMIEAGRQVGASDLFMVQERRSTLHLQATEFIDAYDFVLTPTLPRTAWPFDDDHPTINAKTVEYGPGGRWADVLLANLTGWPAVSIPCGFVDGLPVGLQIIAPWRADGPCLDFAQNLEQILTPLTSTTLG
ncbi:amidase [Rhodococcus jostii]|uniref:amidase n=1 Tax=Rhodococcus jostii TaxID=132919 RepID=A0A1H4QWT5_RHOJO|nr:amidase [Rhodococcus jostii]SEC23944.1 aspartyl-tRNA(Asn)/glutamyl-tRNA(Gln) amidotransferase subunit A [Rhodococcus jostii]